MNEFKPEAARIDTVAARLELPGQECYASYVGLDVHKETIAVAERIKTDRRDALKLARLARIASCSGPGQPLTLNFHIGRVQRCSHPIPTEQQ